MKAKRHILLGGLLLLSALVGCKESPALEHIQQRSSVTINGQFLTQSPDEIQFPVKVLFAIDCSLSMGQEIDGASKGADPAFQRIDAVRNFISEYNVNDNVSFEIMLWSTSVFERTRNPSGDFGFTKNEVELNRVLDAVRNDTQTDYLGAMSEVYKDIQRDIQQEGDSVNLERTKYMVVFLSDGIPNDQGKVQADNDIFNSVKDVLEMTEVAGVGGFNMHTFLLLGGFPAGNVGDEFRAQAKHTLQSMANIGEGRFTEFENAQAVNFLNLVDIRLSVEYILKYVIAYNINTIPGTELIIQDTDGDGLSDEKELEYGSNPTLKDSDNDGASDYVEWSLTTPDHIFNPNTQLIDPDGDGPLTADAPDNNCIAPSDGIWPDTDMDLLNDCEEELLGTDRRVVDTDGDGIPDGLEFLAGTNLFFAEDIVDSDLDGFANPIEIRNHTNVKSNDPKLQQRYAYQYELIDQGKVRVEQGTSEGTVQSVRRLFTLDVSNIDIMDTAWDPVNGMEYDYDPRSGKFYDYSGMGNVAYGPGDNKIIVFVAQVPSDKPNDPPIFSRVDFIVNINDSGSAKHLEFHSDELVGQAGLQSKSLEKLN